MNASGRPNTCKSNEIKDFGSWFSGARVRNAYATYLPLGDSPPKGGLIPHNTFTWHQVMVKAFEREKMGMRAIS
jgi:hypothetical protein